MQRQQVREVLKGVGDGGGAEDELRHGEGEGGAVLFVLLGFVV